LILGVAHTSEGNPLLEEESFLIDGMTATSYVEYHYEICKKKFAKIKHDINDNINSEGTEHSTEITARILNELKEFLHELCSYQSQFKAAYDSQLKRNPELSGKICGYWNKLVDLNKKTEDVKVQVEKVHAQYEGESCLEQLKTEAADPEKCAKDLEKMYEQMNRYPSRLGKLRDAGLAVLTEKAKRELHQQLGEVIQTVRNAPQIENLDKLLTASNALLSKRDELWIGPYKEAVTKIWIDELRSLLNQIGDEIAKRYLDEFRNSELVKRIESIVQPNISATLRREYQRVSEAVSQLEEQVRQWKTRGRSQPIEEEFKLISSRAYKYISKLSKHIYDLEYAPQIEDFKSQFSKEEIRSMKSKEEVTDLFRFLSDLLQSDPLKNEDPCIGYYLRIFRSDIKIMQSKLKSRYEQLSEENALESDAVRQWLQVKAAPDLSIDKIDLVINNLCDQRDKLCKEVKDAIVFKNVLEDDKDRAVRYISNIFYDKIREAESKKQQILQDIKLQETKAKQNRQIAEAEDVVSECSARLEQIKSSIGSPDNAGFCQRVDTQIGNLIALHDDTAAAVKRLSYERFDDKRLDELSQQYLRQVLAARDSVITLLYARWDAECANTQEAQEVTNFNSRANELTESDVAALEDCRARIERMIEVMLSDLGEAGYLKRNRSISNFREMQKQLDELKALVELRPMYQKLSANLKNCDDALTTENMEKFRLTVEESMDIIRRIHNKDDKRIIQDTRVHYNKFYKKKQELVDKWDSEVALKVEDIKELSPEEFVRAIRQQIDELPQQPGTLIGEESYYKTRKFVAAMIEAGSKLASNLTDQFEKTLTDWEDECRKKLSEGYNEYEEEFKTKIAELMKTYDILCAKTGTIRQCYSQSDTYEVVRRLESVETAKFHMKSAICRIGDELQLVRKKEMSSISDKITAFILSPFSDAVNHFNELEGLILSVKSHMYKYNVIGNVYKHILESKNIGKELTENARTIAREYGNLSDKLRDHKYLSRAEYLQRFDHLFQSEVRGLRRSTSMLSIPSQNPYADISRKEGSSSLSSYRSDPDKIKLALTQLGTWFGVHKEDGFPNQRIIDISYPSVLGFAESVLREIRKSNAGRVVDAVPDSLPDIEEQLKIKNTYTVQDLPLFIQLANIMVNKSDKQQFCDKDSELLISLFFGKNKFFYIPPELNFERANPIIPEFAKMLQNHTGLQTVLSLVLFEVASLHRMPHDKIATVMVYNKQGLKRSQYDSSSHSVELDNSSKANVLCHEIGHAFQHRIGLSVIKDASDFMVESMQHLPDNSFLEMYYPALRRNLFEKAISIISKYLPDDYSTQQRGTYAVDPIEKIKKTSLAPFVNSEKSTHTKEDFAKAIWLSNTSIYREEGKYEKVDVWNNPIEMMEVQGISVFEFDGSFVTLMNRQNENMYRRRGGLGLTRTYGTDRSEIEKGIVEEVNNVRYLNLNEPLTGEQRSTLMSELSELAGQNKTLQDVLLGTESEFEQIYNARSPDNETGKIDNIRPIN
jgi:hypothetical protein